MALEMVLELEGSPPDWQAIKKALERAGAEHVEALLGGDKEKFTNFPDSRLQVTAHRSLGPPTLRPMAEGNHDCHFPVDWTMTLRISNGADYDKCVEDIHEFLNRLVEESSIQFVLSFQREGVYAFRDRKRGFNWFWESPRLPQSDVQTDL